MSGWKGVTKRAPTTFLGEFMRQSRRKTRLQEPEQDKSPGRISYVCQVFFIRVEPPLY